MAVNPLAGLIEVPGATMRHPTCRRVQGNPFYPLIADTDPAKTRNRAP